MKLHNIALIGILLGSSPAFAVVDKEITPTKDSDTEKFLCYSALALTNGGLSLFPLCMIYKDITSGSQDNISYLLGSVLVPTTAILAISDAKTAWHYYQKAFPIKNKIERSSSLTSKETKASSTKKTHAAKLIGYSGLALINIATTALGSWVGIKELQKNPPNIFLLIYLLLNGQATSRLALSNFQSMKEHYKKAFPSNDLNKETSHETA